MGSGHLVQVSELNLLSLTWTSWPPLTKVVYCHAYLPPKTHLSMSVVQGLQLSRLFLKQGRVGHSCAVVGEDVVIAGCFQM